MRIQFIQNFIDKLRGKHNFLKIINEIQEIKTSVVELRNFNNLISSTICANQKEINELKNIINVLNDTQTSEFQKIINTTLFNQNKELQDMINNSFYSQFGEDRIISLALGILQSKGIISEISYLDIGGNRAKEISNTYYFYLRGCKGCVIEPNPRLASKFKEVRPQDNVLNIGIHFGDNMPETMPFYMLNEEADGLSSFSKESVEKMLKDCPIATEYETINVPVRNVNDVISENFEEKSPTFVSLDVEGIETEILKSFDFEKYRPCFFIVETAGYTSEQFLGKKESETTEFMILKDYVIYADTYINTIYIDKNILEKMYKQE